jgi:hypothetical protein
MSNDIRDIIERLAILEGRITPVDVTHGLNADQKSVKQLPALFKPKTQKILGGNPNAKNPMSGYMVGASESTDEEEADKEVVEEAQANEEKLLDKVKKSLVDYLGSIEDKYRDADIKDKKKDDRDLGKKSADKDLVAKEKEVVEDPTQEDPVTQASTIPVENPTYAESACVKSMVLENGAMFEIHGNERTGFEIRHGNRTMKSRFKNIDEAAMAIEMFRARQRKQDQSADYIEEA